MFSKFDSLVVKLGRQSLCMEDIQTFTPLVHEFFSLDSVFKITETLGDGRIG
jgi:hypothetical protein